MANDPNNPVAFDAARETAAEHIQILTRPDGATEFILPALRNIRAKVAFLIAWLAFGACIAVFGFISTSFVEKLPPILKFLAANHAYFFLGILLLIELLLTIANLDMWLRNSRVIVRPGIFEVVTHWLFVRRKITVSTERIIELRADNNTSVNEDLYYDIIALTLGNGRSRLVSFMPPPKPDDSQFTANRIKSIQTGGRRVVLATNIKGKDEVMWLLDQIRAAGGIEV